MITKQNILEAKSLPDGKFVPIEPKEFYGVPGREHYNLLSYLATTISNSTIIDIGTHMGSSALALSVNASNTVYSFDIVRKTPLSDLPNVNFEIADLWDPATREYWAPIVLGSALIVLDIDPHSGVPEYEFYLWLKKNHYKGLVFCDDIHYFKEMRDNFWLKIPSSEKLDITAIGHWSGSGIISFQPRPDLVWETYTGLRSIGQEPAPSPWTVVTAYFDLTKMPDATDAIRNRDKKHYLDSARITMNLQQNLVVFCEEDSLEELKALRPAHLLERTKFYTVDFESLPMTKYRVKITEDRIRRSYAPDPRNTPSYYLLCMARYALLKRIMKENPFGSTHFAWLNLCIERMGFSNIVHLDEVFAETPRDKVSTAYIDYLPQSYVENLPEYFQFGRCTLCSGFFTGRQDYLSIFCNKVEEQFLEFLEAGYGHADEQLFSPVYFKNRDIFDLYYGDYQQMITNYRYTYENPRITLALVIPKSAEAEDWDTCLNACKFLWASHEQEKISLSETEQKICRDFYCKALASAALKPQHVGRLAKQWI